MLNDGMNLGFHCTMPSLQICLDIEINGPSDLHVKPTKLFIWWILTETYKLLHQTSVKNLLISDQQQQQLQYIVRIDDNFSTLK